MSHSPRSGRRRSPLRDVARSAGVLALTLGLMATGGTVAFADDDLVIGTTRGVDIELDQDGATYRLVLSESGTETWSTAATVGVRTPGDTDYAYVAYADAERTGGAVVASATVSTARGSRILVTDRLSADDAGLHVDRAFEVLDAAAGDEGFSLSFALRDASGEEPDSYKWFAPGTLYGNSDEGSFTELNKMAFVGTVSALGADALGAPVLSNLMGGRVLSLRDRTDGRNATIVADAMARTGKTLVDERFDVAGLGVRAASDTGTTHTEVFHTYPAWTHNYRGKYTGNDIDRFLPLTVGRSGDTAFDIVPDEAGSLPEMAERVWRESYDLFAQTIDRFDPKIHFDTLVDYVDSTYGVLGGRPQYSTTYDHKQSASGFLWRNVDLAWVMLEQGWDRGDEGMRDRALTVIEDQLTAGGMDHESARETTDAYLGLIRAYLAERDHGVTHEGWLTRVRNWADNDGTGSTSWFAAEIMVLLSETVGDSRYRDRAAAALDEAWDEGQNRMIFMGAIDDFQGGLPEHDRESGYSALDSYLAMYRSENPGDIAAREKWLTRAEAAATYAESWQRVADSEMVPADAGSSLIMYGNDHVPSYGLSIINAGTSGADVYNGWGAPAFYELYLETGDEHYLDFAVYTEKNSMLYTNMGDKAGWMADSLHGTGLGFTNEYLGLAVDDAADNAGRGDGHDSNIAWVPHVLLGRTQLTLDRFGQYSVGGPALSDINGLNAYYRLVNTVTGQALGIDSASTQVGAHLQAQDGDAAERTQQWLFQPMGDGTVKLVNRGSGKVAAVEGTAKAGAPLSQAIFQPDLEYRVTLSDSGDGSIALRLGTGFALEQGYSSATVSLNTASGSGRQGWRLEPVGDLQLLAPSIRTSVTAAGGALTMTAQADDATLAQRWSAIRLDSGHLAIVSRDTGRVLTASTSATMLRVADRAQGDGYGPDQQWSVVLDGDGYATLVARTGTTSGPYRLQTAGPATQAAPASVVRVTPTSATVEAGAPAPDLGDVQVEYSDGTTGTVTVSWESIDPAGLQTPGTFTVLGSIDGTALPARATIQVLGTAAIVSVDPVEVRTPTGVAPELPATVTARDAADATYDLPVTWAAVDPADYAAPGEFTVSGTLAGVAVAATATVTVFDPAVSPIASFEPVRTTTLPGTAPTLPNQVVAIHDDGSRSDEPVSWAAIDPAEYDSTGFFQVVGTVPGTGLTATAYVSVAIFHDDFSSGDMSQWEQKTNADYTVTGGVASTPSMAGGQSQVMFAKAGDGTVLSGGDVVVEAVIRIPSHTGNGGLFVRSQAEDDANGYFFGLEGHTRSANIGTQVGGSWQEGAGHYRNADTAPGQFHTIRLVLDGKRVAEYINGSSTPLFTAADFTTAPDGFADFPQGHFGIRSWQAGIDIDSYTITPIPGVVAVPQIELSTSTGIPATLPTTVAAIHEDGSLADVAVTWDPVDPSRWNTPGTVEVDGSAADGTPARAVVTVADNGITGVRGVLVLTDPGVQPELPDEVTLVDAGGATTTASVAWPPATPDQLAAPGYFTLVGDVDGTDLDATATVGVATVSAPMSGGSCPPDGWHVNGGGTWTQDGLGCGPTKARTQAPRAVPDMAPMGDMIVEADVSVASTAGNRQAGFMIRTEDGTGATESGYYVGIENNGGFVIIGRLSGGWSDLASSARNLPGITVGATVHLRVILQGGALTVYANDMSTPVVSYSGVSLPDGAVGVRSYNSTGRFANFRVATLPPPLSVQPVDVTTVEGVMPSLPAAVEVTDWTGSVSTAAVRWDVDGLEFLGNTTVTVPGVITGTGTVVSATVTVLPATLDLVETVAVRTTPQLAPTLPDTVRGRLSTGHLVDIPVTWTAVEDATLARVGVYELSGSYTWVGNPGQASGILIVHSAEAANLATTVAVIEAANLVEDDYTASSWSDLMDALADARSVLSDEHASQQAIDDADAALRGAFTGLEPASDDIDEARAALAELIARVELMDTSQYTAESVAALQAALAHARTVRDDPTATLNQILDATRALNAAVAGLMPAPVVPGDGDGSGVGGVVDRLGRTGTEVFALVGIAAALAIAGAVVLIVVRRRTRMEDEEADLG